MKGSGDRRPTAIIGHNDVAAVGIMRAAAELGLQVPHDVSVVGMDNTPMGQNLPVALTTIDHPTTDEVEAIGELMRMRIENPGYAEPQQREFSSRLIIQDGKAKWRGTLDRVGIDTDLFDTSRSVVRRRSSIGAGASWLGRTAS